MGRTIHAVGLDIGTSKVRCIIAEVTEKSTLDVIGVGEAESKGVRRGIVTYTESVVESIKHAVAEAERMGGVEIQRATVSISGEHFQSENKQGVVAVAGAGREITEEDVSRAIESASAVAVPAGWEIVDVIPQEFIIDGQDGIIEPVGMIGSRLESRVHVITSPSAGRQNLVKAVHNSGIGIEKIVLEPLASAESALTEEDKEYGTALVNMGSEITSLMIFDRGAVRHTAFFPFGGMYLTRDIAHGLRVSIPEAENIKRRFGCAASFLMDEREKQEVIEITPVGRNEKRGLSKEILCDIISPRVVELLQHIAHEITSSKMRISGGVVLTGGSVMVRGFVEIAEQVFDAPTRLGIPDKSVFSGLADNIFTPEWTTACGLAMTSMNLKMQMLSEPKSATKKIAELFGSFFKEKFL
ncbi:MAG: cell division protein FtsA [Pyrinomonadaceae bacterium]|nr:cell division protein FtsA [Pyrinomonadaceae bacterium]MCX7639781.1 cell division protein FtsA [Pyrinomonadaceae bacterium]MDW8304364.1 cell division protein FtsA [Acidobacteriota bacterium]